MPIIVCIGTDSHSNYLSACSSVSFSISCTRCESKFSLLTYDCCKNAKSFSLSLSLSHSLSPVLPRFVVQGFVFRSQLKDPDGVARVVALVQEANLQGGVAVVLANHVLKK